LSLNPEITSGGDFDGDGLDGFGLWVPNTDGMGSCFRISPSSSADPQNDINEVTDPRFAG